MRLCPLLSDLPRHTPRRSTRQRSTARPLSRDEAEGSEWRCQWDDDGAVLAASIRQDFEANVARGEARCDYTLAALQVCAEDDALMSVVGVPLPLAPYSQRIERLAAELRARLTEAPPSCEADTVDLVTSFLFQEQSFRPQPRPALGGSVTVDHPGVYEDPRNAYLTALLVRKVGSSAVLSLLVAAVWRELLLSGAVAFGIRLSLPRSACDLPAARPLLASEKGLAQAQAAGVNTWPAADALADVLRQLKRSYWPFRWDTALDSSEDGPCGSGGGFLAAARAVLGDGADAATEAIARTAAHRLARGIWTSSGAGDLRRARAAAERLVTLLGDTAPRERRDLGVLLLHCGELAAAGVELRAFAGTSAAGLATPAEQEALAGLLAALPGLVAERTAAGPPPPVRKGIPW